MITASPWLLVSVFPLMVLSSSSVITPAAVATVSLAPLSPVPALLPPKRVSSTKPLLRDL